MVARINSILAQGKQFSTEEQDEFYVEHEGKRYACFKLFEYMSLPFTISGRRERFEELLEESKKTGRSLDETIDNDTDSQDMIRKVITKMKENPEFTRQVLEWSLAKVYNKDYAIFAANQKPEELETALAQVIDAWERQSDFYCIEGLVGGQGNGNPIIEGANGHQLEAGFLDCMEDTLPSIYHTMSKEEKNILLLRLSAIVERDYTDIIKAIDVQTQVFGKVQITQEQADEISESLKRLNSTTFTRNIEHGKFFNSLIRFHNWLPIGLKKEDKEGQAYDSICSPTREALRYSGSISESTANIKDATSPKGIGLARLVDELHLADKGRISDELKRLQKKDLKEHTYFEIQDPAFYTGLTGGKWKGIKLLRDAKQLMELGYEVAEGICIASTAINRILEETGIDATIGTDVFSIDDRRETITRMIADINFEQHIPEVFEKMKATGKRLLVRSSMHGEDGISNFSGTYESTPCNPSTLNDALKTVTKSYFSKEAVASREDVGQAHLPGISIIIQEYIEGTGGVIHLQDGRARITYAKNAEEAVAGNGDHQEGKLRDITKGTQLENYTGDLERLHRIFGNIDLEFIAGEKIYLTQMRPKRELHEERDAVKYDEVICFQQPSDLKGAKLEKRCAVDLKFLGQENAMENAEDIMQFIRNNRQYISKVIGTMPPVAHIPNKIEGHFKIPYSYEVKK